MKKVIDKINDLVKDKFEKYGYDRKYGFVTVSNRPDLCQFQCNGALAAAKEYKKSPRDIANDVLSEIKDIQIFQDISIAGPGFININITDDFLTNYINNIYSDKKLGVTESQNPMTIMIDYGGANVAKPLHVGHLRPAIIGESLKRTSRYLGHRVIGDVHLGDWGLQMGMVISEVKRRNPDLPYFDENFDGEYPEEAPFTIDELEEIYPAASKLAKSNGDAMKEAREATSKLQKGNRGYLALWKHILNVSVKDLKKNYSDLNVEFDLWKGESDCQQYIDEMIGYLKDNNYTEESEGALVIDVAKEDDNQPMPPFMVLKSDGSTLYSTTDLATIWERVKDYSPDEIIYVVDKRQGLHFEQVFRCAKKTKIVDENLKFYFLSNGTINGKDGKPFKTRDGGVMRLRTLIDTITDHVRNKLKNNNFLSSEEMNDIAKKVGLSALKFGDLSNQITKDYIFDMDKFSSFEGKTGPYILYTVVRIKSILRKIDVDKASNIINPHSDIERDLMLSLSKFNEVVESAFIDKAPNKMCEYIYEVANQFNKFYHNNKMITEENMEKKMSWINLSNLTKDVLETGLDLLGIEAPDRM